MSEVDTKVSNEKLDEVLNEIIFAAKINLALGFVICNVETGDCR